MKRRRSMSGALLLLSFMLAGCGEPTQAYEERWVLDASKSGLRTDQGDLLGLALPLIERRVGGLQKGGSWSLTAFAADGGGDTCKGRMPNYKVPADANSEEVKSLKEAYAAKIQSGAVQSYVACITSKTHGSARPGSAIFSGITEALVEDPHPDLLVLVTDGLEVSPDAPRAGLFQSKPATVVKQLDPALVPDLSGTDLVVLGLGRGLRGVTGTDRVWLRRLWVAYADAASAASINFTLPNDKEN